MSAPDPIGGIVAQIDVLRAITAIDLTPEEAAALRTLGTLLHRFGTVLLGCAEAVAVAARPVRDDVAVTQARLDALADRSPASPAPDAPAQAAPAGVSRALDVSSPPAPAAASSDGSRAAFSREETPQHVWTGKRDAHLAKRWTQFVTEAVVRAELAAMPGLPIPAHANTLSARASLLGAKRPAGFMVWWHRQRALRDAAPSAVAAQLGAEAARVGVAESDWRAAMDWGARHGVTLGVADEDDDLAAVNARRAEFGLPPFRIIAGRGPSRALPDARLSA
ncbi:MAG: hypothetical protein HIU82_02235 [Proteobacteria bacterium]|nr:hypothetical protein [Pseudomonadota bacterium]